MSQPLAFQPEYIIVSAECDRVFDSCRIGTPGNPPGGDLAPVTQTYNELANIVGKPGRADAKLH
jgi:hypothetical protein